jgi:hypothetical protein
MERYQKEMLVSALQSFGTCDVVVEGQSMKPFIRSGDTVTLARLTGEKGILPGTVVAFYCSDQLIVHRVICVKKNESGGKKLFVWGDSSWGMPAVIEAARCIGTVVAVTRNGRPAGRWLRFPFTLLAIGAGILIHLVHTLKKQYVNTSRQNLLN